LSRTAKMVLDLHVVSENAGERVTWESREAMRVEIDRADGQEVLFLGHCNRERIVTGVEVFARGNHESVAAVVSFCEPGDMVIHNHPSGDLRPSDADVMVSAHLAETGVGSAIVDNAVELIYVLVEPLSADEIDPVDGDHLAEILLDGGAMTAVLPGFVERPSQVAMLREVVRGFNESAVVVAEAGTGVGKSLAYLIPAVAWVARNRGRVVIATATINLQQQLLEKDLVLVQRALGTTVKTALVKGRGNYLCRRRLAERAAEADLFIEDDFVRAVLDWVETTPTGSRSDVPFFVGDEHWNQINSEPDTCSASRCPDRERCFVLQARRRAAGAGILIANHHLVFSDLSIRNAGAGWDSTAILPPFSRIILDEAHNLERAATSFFSDQVSQFSILRLAGRLLRVRGAHRFGLVEQLPGLGLAEERVRRIESALGDFKDLARRLNAELVTFMGNESTWRSVGSETGRFIATAGHTVQELQQAALGLAQLLARVLLEIAEDKESESVLVELPALIRRLEAISAVLGRFSELDRDDDAVLWLDRHRDGRGESYIRLVITPLDIRTLMEESLFQPHETVVLTSATLTVNGSFQFWGGRLGVPLGDDRTLTGVFPSPFDYAGRVLLGVPADAPGPENQRYEQYLTMLVPRLVSAVGGGALVLFTSYRRLEHVFAAVAEDLEKRGFTCYRQGGDDRSRLLEQFRTDVASVLFATDSFWEGVDAPGETLRLVILCRLPFRVPTDPVQLARAEAIVEAGGNAFTELSLPQAVMRLKQGFGRLMRRSDDYGAVVVADPRMVRKPYGRLFFDSLPPARRLVGSGEEIVEEVREFTAQKSRLPSAGETA
jgi:ATP-dependent DNA helicase DinG